MKHTVHGVTKNWTWLSNFYLFTIVFLFKLYLYLYVHACSVVSDSLWPHGLYVAHQAPFSMGFAKQENWCGLSFPPQGIFQTHGNLSLASPKLTVGLFTTTPPGKHFICISNYSKLKKKNHWIIEKDVAVSQSLSYVWLFATPWMVAHQALLSSTISWSLLKFMPNESSMLHYHLIFYCPLLLLPSILPSIRIFSRESTLLIRRPMYWSFSLFFWQGCDPRRGENYLRRE